MEGFLTDARIRYVLYHLKNHVALPEPLMSRFVFSRGGSANESGKIVFELSPHSLNPENTPAINSIPVLFPLGTATEFYTLDSANNLVFHHDILKSAFYLLSGYQEFSNRNSHDKLNRFDFEHSIQRRLNITLIPVVNYYFDIICEAIEKYCSVHNLKFVKKRLFKNLGFQLSHDIDRVDLYSFPYLGYKTKELVGIVKTPLSRQKNLKLLISGTLKYLGIKSNDNPYWNFEFLRKLERRHNFRSIFFFLDQGIKHSDAYYSFQEKRIRQLFKFLLDEKCEIALHGPVRSMTSQSIMNSSLRKLSEASGIKIVGNRQHRLLWVHPDTAVIEERAGLQYDSTLGFAAHEGFRNSYCYPFRIFDFENEAMLNIWEFPLNVMDVTLLGYRKYTNNQALETCQKIIMEVNRFGGIFTLLWHNSFFDEDVYPGVNQLYENILKSVADQQPECVLGNELLSHMQDLTAAYD